MDTIFILILVQSPNLIKFKYPPPPQKKKGLSRRLFSFRRAPFQGRVGGGVGTPPYKLCRYVQGQMDCFFEPFWSEIGYRLYLLT